MTTNIEPTVQPVIERPKVGFNDYAERLNGPRAAMVGFVAVVIIEVVTRQTFLSWLALELIYSKFSLRVKPTSGHT